MGNVIKRRLERAMPDGRYVIADLEMRTGDTGLSPAFSLTGEIWENHGHLTGVGRHRRHVNSGGEWGEADCFGALSEDLVRAFPKLKFFERMHLADPTSGEPMHAEANGWYWYQGSRHDLPEYNQYHGGNTTIYPHQLADRGVETREEYCYKVACDLLRVESIPEEIVTREQFAAFVDELRAGWRREAAEAQAFIESLPA